MLKEGDKAPSFNLESDEGGRVSLRDFADKTLVLYFYPRDNTPGCTRQAQAFSSARRAIEAKGAAVIGVSRDSLKSHASFREKCGLGITLLSDPDLTTHKAYGAWGTKTMYGKKIEGVLRTTFVISRGKVTRVFPNVKVDGHAEAVLAALGSGASAGSKPAKAAAPRTSTTKKPAAKAPAAKALATKKPAKPTPKKKGSTKK